MERELNSANLAFRSRLKMLAEKLGGVSGLARAAGFNESTVRQWVDGPAEPNRTKLVAIATGAGVDVGWLATGQGPRAPGEAGDVPMTSEQRGQHAAGIPSGQQQAQALSNSMNATPAPSPYRPAADLNLPLMGSCLAAAQQLPAHLSPQQQIEMALVLADAINYLANGRPVTCPLAPEDLLAIARIFQQLHDPALGDPEAID